MHSIVFAETYAQSSCSLNDAASFLIRKYLLSKECCRGVVDFSYLQKEGLASPVSVSLGRIVGWKELVVNYGPLFDNGCFFVMALDSWIDELLCLGSSLNVCRVILTPPFHSFWQPPLLNISLEYDRLFSCKKFTLQKSYSIVLDNEVSESFVWKKMKSEARRKVRKAIDAQIEIRESFSTQDFLHYLDAKGLENKDSVLKDYVDYRERNSLRGFPDAGHCGFYIAEKDSIPLAWQMVSWGKNVAILEGNCVSDYARENRLYGNHLLQWYVIQEAIRRGVRWIDWVGADPEPKTQKQKNITEFKLLWGGEIVTYNTYEYRFKNWRNSLFDFLKGCKDWKNRTFGGE